VFATNNREDIAMTRLGSLTFALMITALAGAAPAHAQTPEQFFRGKTVEVYVGYTTGGGYDDYARLLAKHMGKQIPGQPTLVVRNMPGAGSLRLANFLASAAKADGTVFGTFARGGAVEPLLGTQEAQFDATRFGWIGSMNNEVSVCAAWHTSPVKTWEDLKTRELIVGGTGTGADTDVFPRVLKNVLGAQFKLISGYPGGNEILLALERGEVSGRCGWSWSSVVANRMNWVREGKISILAQLALDKHPDLPNVPLIMDKATNEEQRQILRFIFSRQTMGRPFAGPPGMPADRLTALRRAFDATLKDREFLVAAQRVDLEINPVDGERLDVIVKELYALPKSLLASAAEALTR
jgi:tripartite-type tricarboxylate transporter receptor subunit TctC